MTAAHFASPSVTLLDYEVAAADMFLGEEEYREVLADRDASGRLRIWGATPDCSNEKVSLCQVFLEYAMYYAGWCSTEEARFHIQDFGEMLGHRIARYLEQDPVGNDANDPVVIATEQVLAAAGADFWEESTEFGIRFLSEHCPIEEAVSRSGIHHAEIARHGLNAMLSALIHDLDPHSEVRTAPEALPLLRLVIAEPALG